MLVTKVMDAAMGEMSREEALRAYGYDEYLAEWARLFGQEGSGVRQFDNGCGVVGEMPVFRLTWLGFETFRQTLLVAHDDIDALVLEMTLLF